MFDPRVELLASAFRETAARPSDESWEQARHAYDVAKATDPEVETLLERRDAPTLQELTEAWHAGSRVLLRPDREVLKRAMRAFHRAVDEERRRREEEARLLELAELATSASGPSIRPPESYPIAVWNLLARHGRLVDQGHGEFALPE